jgi:hypothetical protein
MKATTSVLHAMIVAMLALTCQAQPQPPDSRRPGEDFRRDGRGRTAPAKVGNALYCDKSPCMIPVEVRPDCRIIGPEYVAVSRELRTVMLVWTIETPRWVFPPRRGIVFKGTNRDLAKRVFRDASEGRPPNEVWIEDDNTVPGEFRYNVNVENAPQRCRRDPIIINDMGPSP